jgi:IS1 family transposase
MSYIPLWSEKNEVYVMTLVDRHTSCIVGWAAAPSRTEATLQALVDAAPQARFYYSDLLAVYRSLLYTPGIHTPMPNKSETFRVEGDNAELRHYLARLARRSRCFSRCIHALRRAIRLFVYLWNTRQLHRQRFPAYPAHLIDFLPAQL